MSVIVSQLIIGFKMGNICQDAGISEGVIDKLMLSNPNHKNMFTEVGWPEEPQFTAEVEELKQSQEWEGRNMEGKRMYKKNSKEEYYLGDWGEEQQQVGQGMLYVPGQLTYFGEFDKLPNGKGVLNSIEEKWTYDGEFKDGRMQGEGVIKSHSGVFTFEGIIGEGGALRTGNLDVRPPEDPNNKAYRVTLSNYPENPAQIHYQNNSKYTGSINPKTFVPEGQGRLEMPNNKSYQGEWKEGLFDGQGRFAFHDGSSYEGEYSQGKKHGRGVHTFPSGKVYDGEWMHGLRHGLGEERGPNGAVIRKGEWKHDRFDETSRDPTAE